MFRNCGVSIRWWRWTWKFHLWVRLEFSVVYVKYRGRFPYYLWGGQTFARSSTLWHGDTTVCVWNSTHQLGIARCAPTNTTQKTRASWTVLLNTCFLQSFIRNWYLLMILMGCWAFAGVDHVMLVQCEGLLPPGSDLLELQNLMACGNLEMEFSVTKGEISLFSILNAFLAKSTTLDSNSFNFGWTWSRDNFSSADSQLLNQASQRQRLQSTSSMC